MQRSSPNWKALRPRSRQLPPDAAHAARYRLVWAWCCALYFFARRSFLSSPPSFFSSFSSFFVSSFSFHCPWPCSLSPVLFPLLVFFITQLGHWRARTHCSFRWSTLICFCHLPPSCHEPQRRLKPCLHFCSLSCSSCSSYVCQTNERVSCFVWHQEASSCSCSWSLKVREVLFVRAQLPIWRITSWRRGGWRLSCAGWHQMWKMREMCQ